jgi:hypothetical protein
MDETTQPVDDREKPGRYTQADDLVERLLTQADGSRTPSLLKEAATRIKELTAEVERLRVENLHNEHNWNVMLTAWVEEFWRSGAAEARATKAEEALASTMSAEEVRDD